MAAQTATPAPAVEAGASTEVNGASPSQAKANGIKNGASAKPAAAKGRSLSRPLRAMTKKKGPPGGYDDTPLPDAPPGYTVRFIFESAANLPPSDFTNASSDPFLTATLRANNPKRHKEDPDLQHRTPTVRSTTAPRWHDEWIVANVPRSGFTLKCRLYDEDYPDADDRLGNVTVKIPEVYEGWEGIPPPGREFHAKKRMISKHAFFLKGVSSIVSQNFHMTPRLRISIEVLGLSDPPHAQMYTLGPTTWFRHFSPMIGRLITGTKVEREDGRTTPNPPAEGRPSSEPKHQKYE
jgi:hypothetical protein